MMKFKRLVMFVVVLLCVAAILAVLTLYSHSSQASTSDVPEIIELACAVGVMSRPKAFVMSTSNESFTYLSITLNCCTELKIEKVVGKVLYLREVGNLCRCFCLRKFKVSGTYRKIIIETVDGKKVEIEVKR